MIHLVTALKAEAMAFISAYSMKRLPGEDRLVIYEAASLRLLLTGTGKIPAAAVVTEYLSRFCSPEKDIFCNFGCCGAADSSLKRKGFLCVSLTDAATGRSVYPELFDLVFPPARLSSVDKVLLSSPQKQNFTDRNVPPLLYDMEGYGVAFALSRFVPPSRMFFYKVVSDVCDGELPDASQITGFLSEHVEKLFAFLKEEEKSSFLINGNLIKYPDFEEDAKKSFTFTTALLLSFQKLLSYAASIHFDEDRMRMLLPASPEKKTKKDTGFFLSALKKMLLTEAAFPVQAKETYPPLSFSPFVYVEEEVLFSEVTDVFLKKQNNPVVIPIKHYKDVFCRSHQNRHCQGNRKTFLLAANHGTLFYQGAPVCQSFNEENFYYTSCIMNCVYDCDYCYLQGMYPSGNVVVFTNLSDYFSQLKQILSERAMYLCCSYDSDLIALSGLFPHAEEFCRFAAMNPSLLLELRTKCASLPFIQRIPSAKNIILAFTISPEEIVSRYEHHSSPLFARLKAAKEAAKRSLPLRLCIDPVLDVPDALSLYGRMLQEVFQILSTDDIKDISIGVFRMSAEYEKQLKKVKPFCSLSLYPYAISGGICHYNRDRADRLTSFIIQSLLQYGIREEQLFLWSPT